MKLLAVHDSPTLETGFSRVAQNLLRRWKLHFERIDIWAIGYHGYPGAPGYAESEWFRPPFVLYPASYGTEFWYAQPRLQALLDHIVHGDYTHLFIIQDHFLLAQCQFPKCLQEACEKKGIKSYYYVPVDAPLDPSWAEIAECVNFPVAYTEYGKGEIERWTGRVPRPGGQYFPDIHVLPHGVDARVYRPLANRNEIRTERSQGWLKPEHILLLNVNANQRRKDVIRSLQILAELHHRGLTNARLLMHMATDSPDMVNLEVAGRQLGLTLRKDWDHTGDYFRHGNSGPLSEKDLNEIYNMADVYLTTTLGEGWGLGITEALAAGCPVAVPDHTACAEIATQMDLLGMPGRVVRLKCEKHGGVLPYDNSRLRFRVDVDAACDAISAYCASSEEFRKRPPLNERVKYWLDWDRIATRWMELFVNGQPKGRHYYIEYGGGLGDVWQGMYTRGSYNVLRDLEPDETATVALACHNPFARELFEWHPKRNQLELLDLGYWDVRDDAEHRGKHKLPRRGALGRLPEKPNGPRDIEFYPSPEDLDVFKELATTRPIRQDGGQFVVFSASAGEPDRNLPPAIVRQILERLHQENVPVIAVGRSYARNDRVEQAIECDLPNFINLIDRLSTPGTAFLLSRATGIVTCHSALSLLGWYMAKPMLLLYSKPSYERHIVPRNGRKGPDQWAFGIENGRTVHCLFEQFEGAHLDRFLNMASLVPPNRIPGVSRSDGWNRFAGKLTAEAVAAAQCEDASRTGPGLHQHRANGGVQ